MHSHLGKLLYSRKRGFRLTNNRRGGFSLTWATSNNNLGSVLGLAKGVALV